MPEKIMVVDDDKEIRDILKKYLAENNFSVVMTDNGSEGLMLVRESQPDILLLDAEMPGLDGYSVCRVLKREPATRQLPVIIM